MIKRITSFLEQALTWLMKRNWRVIAGGILIILFFEIFEILHKNEPLYDPFHLTELILYIFILALVGVLINFLIETNATLNRTMEVLKQKHDVSLKLTELENWDSLTNELIRLPGTIAPVEGSQLYVRNPISNELEIVADWNVEGAERTLFNQDCRKCLQEQPDAKYLFGPCAANPVAADTQTQTQEFCLPINYANGLVAVIQFKLQAGEELSQNQMEILENISPEIALALKASQGRKNLAEMRSAETALAERHSVSTFLHDHLSQNLAYLCLKLEQLSKEEDLLPVEYQQIELQHMRDAANQSYEILRDMIETMHPETTPRLVNLFNEHAKKVSERGHFKISITTTGQEAPISPNIQKAIFYVFQEAIRNVEKHANAKNVKVTIDWSKDSLLNVNIADDGVGFDLQNLDATKHFGLEIMQERVDKVKGKIGIHSSAELGTEINISVPILVPQKERQ